MHKQYILFCVRFSPDECVHVDDGGARHTDLVGRRAFDQHLENSISTCNIFVGKCPLSQHQYWISSRILPVHHPGAPRTAGHFSDLADSLQSRQSWTWWGGWRRRPGTAGSGRRETASRFLLLPSSSSCRLSDGRFLYWDLSSVSPTYKPRLTRQSFQAFLLSVECCGRLSVGRRLMCIEYVYC